MSRLCDCVIPFGSEGFVLPVDKILDYFIEYEANERFVQNSLTDTSGSEYSKDILNNVNKIQNEIVQKKKELILMRIKDLKQRNFLKFDAKGELSYIELRHIIEKSIRCHDLALIQQVLKFTSNKVQKDFYQFLTPLLKDDEITICYPILEGSKAKYPVLTFTATIEDNALTVSNCYMNKNSLVALLADFKKFDPQDVEYFYNNEIHDALRSIKRIQGQKELNEIIKLVKVVLFEYFNLADIKLSNHTGGCRLIDKVLITTETLNEMRDLPFREEIALVKQKLKDTNKSLVHKYLEINSSQLSYSESQEHTGFHYGSYTADYSVNEKQWQVVTKLGTTKLLSVNGPPGTGKTTLLKEIIANNFVEKTKELLSVWDKGWTKVNEGTKREAYLSPFNGKNNKSMIITSTNNKAVDNIGLELLQEIDYLSENLNSSEIKGMFCARLGNQTNINKFKSDLLHPLLNGLSSHNTSQDNVKEQFLSLYNDLGDIHKKINQFTQLTAKLREETAAQLELSIKEEQHNYNHIVRELEENSHKIEQRNTELNQINTVLSDLNKKEKDAQLHLADIQEHLKLLYINFNKHKSYQKFKILNKISGKRKAFLAEYPTAEYINSLISASEEKRQRLEILHEELKDRLKKMHSTKATHEHVLEVFLSERESLRNEHIIRKKNLNFSTEIMRQKNELENILHIDIVDLTDTYQLANCEKIYKLRHHLFELSLKVNEAYIRKNNLYIGYNLKKIIEDDMWFKAFYNPTQESRPNYEKGLRALWETFCMVFPVVTTTVHSLHTKTFPMIPKLFDQVLIDESGQILPHYVIGALFRANQAVVVGDVFQLEPIRLQNSNLIDKYQSIDERMHEMVCIEMNSVQSYSDMRSDIYEQIGKDKVGVILEEHRRCENSIAQFSNQFVYNGKLTIVEQDNHDKPLGRNLVTFDVRGKQRSDNVNELEASMCERIIEYLRSTGINSDDIAIITPYKNQVIHLKNKLKNIDIGTVHTFQGQEKKIILFSSVIQTEDKSNFLGRKPNMLNVALTRAKAQFIWVGNFDAIQRSNNYLKHAAKVLQERGIIYSIYDMSLNHNIEGAEIDEAIRLYSDRLSQESTKLNQYLLANFSQGILKGPKNHTLFFKKALDYAESSIVIISPWITNYVVNHNFKEKLNSLLKNNVKVKIIFGYHKSNYKLDQIDYIVDLDCSSKDKGQIVNAIKALYQLLGDQLIYKPPLHAKLLLIDEKYLVIGSFNWLSNSGEWAGAKDEISCIITDQRYIKFIKECY